MKRTILIIDDMRSWQQFYKELFSTEYVVKTISYFDEALAFIKNHKFDLAILDIHLDFGNCDNVDGLRLIKIIRDLDDKIPIVIVTGYPEYSNCSFLFNFKPIMWFLKSEIKLFEFKENIDNLLYKRHEIK